MGYSWGIGHEPDGPTVDGLSWRWWRRERTVRIPEGMVVAGARTLAEIAEVLDGHHVGAAEPCVRCSASTAELRRLAVDLGEWCR